MFLASREINNLSVFNTREYSDILFRSGSVWRLVHAAIFFSFNCLRYACALPISSAGHWAFGCDLLLRVIWLGRDGAFRKKVVDLAGMRLGESVLDVGCGNGTRAITA